MMYVKKMWLLVLILSGFLLAGCDFGSGVNKPSGEFNIEDIADISSSNWQNLSLAPVSDTDRQGGLRELADEVGINLGTAIGGSNFMQNTQYTGLLHKHFNHATPENAMKWQPLLGQGRRRYNWSTADRFVAEAQRSGQRIRGHALIWHSQNPGWLDNGSWTPAELRYLMEEHFAVMARSYADVIYAWDVVNEAFTDPDRDNPDSVHRSRSIWYTTIGNSYIAEAFTLAREYFPDARLYYNDYNISGGHPWTNVKAERVYQMAEELVNTGVPIDGVGFQMHIQLGHNFNIAAFKQNLQRFIDLGLRVDITEIDIRIADPASPADLEAQAALYAEILQAYLELDRDYADTFITWGISDDQSWIPDVFNGFGSALLFDENRNAKPAYDAIKEVLEEELQ